MNLPLTTAQIKDLPSALVQELAIGVEDPVEVAYRYGITASQFKVLKDYPPFANAVAAQKAEYEKSGFTVKVKAALMADPLLDKYFTLAMSEDASMGQVADAIRLVAKLGDLEPKPTAVAAGAGGPNFSIQINIPQLPQATKDIVEDKLALAMPTLTRTVEVEDVVDDSK